MVFNLRNGLILIFTFELAAVIVLGFLLFILVFVVLSLPRRVADRVDDMVASVLRQVRGYDVPRCRVRAVRDYWFVVVGVGGGGGNRRSVNSDRE